MSRDWQPEGYDGGEHKKERRKLPPITGMPTERAHCAGCGKILRPLVDAIEQRVDRPGGGYHHEIVGRKFRGWNAYNDLFHSLGCALTFATLAHRAGYRRKT